MIYGALTEAGITIAFPQRDVHLRSDRPFEVQIVREQTSVTPPGDPPIQIDPAGGNGKVTTPTQ